MPDHIDIKFWDVFEYLKFRVYFYDRQYLRYVDFLFQDMQNIQINEKRKQCNIYL